MSQAHIERLELDQLVCWRIHLGNSELLVAQQGAQILHYQHGTQPVIWHSEQASYQSGQPVRGGVPLCWPWFGALTRNPLPVQAMHGNPATATAHGGVRGLDWQLLGIEQQGATVILQFLYDSRQQPLPHWPHAAELRLDIRLDQRLSLSLRSRNLGDQSLHLSQALHSYFAVSDIRQIRVLGLDSCRYIETLEDWQERHQQGALQFSGETDRIYLDVPSRLALIDNGWNRRILLETQGSRSAVLWNPWLEKAQRLSQFANDAWQRMLCIETANIWDDCIELAPGASHELGLSLWSEAL